MGAFNTLNLSLRCSSCGSVCKVRLQFKYGDTWQYSYQMSDEIRWGGNDIGKPAKQVVLDAVAEEPCSSCGAEWPDYEIMLRDNRIVSVQPASGKYDFVSAHDSYIILEE